MRSLLLAQLFFLSYALSAQDTTISRPHRFSAGITFSFNNSYRTMKNNDGSAMSDKIISARDKEELPKIGSTVGLNFCYKLNAKFGIETGIWYSNMGYQTRSHILSWGSGTFTQSRTIYGMYYLDIPLLLNYTAGKGNIRFFTHAGIITNLLIRQTISEETISGGGNANRHTSESHYPFRHLNLSPTAGAGVDFTFRKIIHLRTGLLVRYGLLKIIDTPVTEFLWSDGLNTSINIDF